MTDFGQVIEILRRRGLEYADAARDAPCPNFKLINLAKAEGIYESIAELCDELVPWPVIVRQQDLRPLPYIPADALWHICRTIHAGARSCMLQSDFHGRCLIKFPLRDFSKRKATTALQSVLLPFTSLLYGGHD